MAFVTPVVCAGVVLGASIFLPLPATLPDPKPGIESQITHVFDVNGNEIALFREFETSKPVAIADIPEVLKQAVISSEDRNFYSHGGDRPAGERCGRCGPTCAARVIVQGGSTITQQYVKNAYTGSERTIARKIREAILASQLDRQMSKDEILHRYLSTIYFGEGAYGVGAAAATYFRKEVKDLTLSEAALLAAVIPAPSRYSPRVDPVVAEQRRVQGPRRRCSPRGCIRPSSTTPPSPRSSATTSRSRPPPGPATIVWPPSPQQSSAPVVHRLPRPVARGEPARRARPAVPGRAPGVHDVRPRRAGRRRGGGPGRVLDGNDPDLQMALVAVEPPTGYVRAIVGGRDFNVSQVNNALGAQGGGTGRQPGSSFKPFVLATAFEQGDPADEALLGRAA